MSDVPPSQDPLSLEGLSQDPSLGLESQDDLAALSQNPSAELGEGEGQRTDEFLPETTP